MSECIKSANKREFTRCSIAFLLIIHGSLCHAKTSSNVTSKIKVQSGLAQEYSLKNIAIELSSELIETSNDELGVSMVQNMYNKFKYTSVVPDVDKVLKKMSHKLEAKLNETFSILNYAKDAIANYVKMNNVPVQSIVTPCDDDDYKDKEYEIITTNPNNSYSELPLSLKQVLYQQRINAKKLKGAIKQLYFLSECDILNDAMMVTSKCIFQDQSLLWKSYMHRVKSSPRNVMLLLDHGGSLSKQQFKTVKAVAKQMISVLNSKDKVGVLALSDDWSSPYLTDQCLTPNQVPLTSDLHTISPASEHNKYLLYRFIDSLTKGNGVTNHSLGFQQALQTIKMSNISSSETVMLLYVSRGLLSSLTEAKTVLETISDMLDEIESPVIINTCAVIDESKPIMYEMHFLKAVAEQNYTKYNVDAFENAQKGIMLSVNSSQGVGIAVARFYNTLSEFEKFELGPSVSLPIWDSFSKDLAVSVTVPCGTKPEFGLLGIDLYFSSIAEDVTYYSNYLHFTYAFIINMEGIAVMHPSYPRPTSIKEQPKFVDVSHLEKDGNFTELRQLLVTVPEGQYILNATNSTLKYLWKRAKDWYVVCVVIRQNGVPPSRPYKVSWYPSPTSSKLVHHRLDILPAPSLCRHLNQIATLDAGSLYLSASCFQSPFLYIHSNKDAVVSPFIVQSYMAYLKDNTRLLANPGLREEVRDDVAALAYILEFLHKQHLTGSRAKYIVRRYVTAPSGVLLIYPGSLIAPGLEPTKRTWYLRATENRFSTVLTPPYLDAGGAGYIVTIAYATTHVVVAMDVTFGYVYKLLLERMPFCTEKSVKCFMMDDRGYLIYHPNLIDPNGHGPIEQQHIIHKESLVANDILNHKYFVKKMLCNNYADSTIQRYYRLNTSMTDTLANVVHGEHCVKYQVSAVAGTNVFIGVVNATCEVVATFCPCSMVDRLCLNCNRMEQRECECPCECPLNLDTCTHPNRSFTDNPLCHTLPEQSFTIPMQSAPKMTELKACLPVLCELQLTYETCLGILGCEWCQIDADGESLLAHPFCTSLSTCFNGIFGSVTPYGDAESGPSASEDLLSSTYSPVGPVIGSIIGVCLILALLFYCYRSHSSPTVERFYLTSAQDNQVRMSDLNISDDYHELDNHQDKLLQDTKKPEPISPYCISTGYRRPLTAADSDHGYSTMTPHDESEHLSFAPVEIDSLEDDCTSDATSINTSVSSKQPQVNKFDVKNKLRMFPQQTDLQMTAVPNRNYVIAPVTVHRNMETTQ